MTDREVHTQQKFRLQERVTNRGMQEMDLPFWELHRPSLYLIVQSQYVLINKRALR